MKENSSKTSFWLLKKLIKDNEIRVSSKEWDNTNMQVRINLVSNKNCVSVTIFI